MQIFFYKRSIIHLLVKLNTSLDSLPESSSSGTSTNELDNSNRLIIKYRFRVFFVLIFLSQTSRQTALSKDPACQSFIIAISYGVLVIYSIDYAGGSLNFAYAFAQDFWNQVEYGQQSAFKFLGNYFICNLCGGLLALAIHSLIAIKAHDLSTKHNHEIIVNEKSQN